MKINLTKNDIEELIAAIEIIHKKEAKMSINRCKDTGEDSTCWYVYMKKKLNTALNSKANKK